MSYQLDFSTLLNSEPLGNKPPRLLKITWNLFNRKPNAGDITALLQKAKQHNQTYDAIVICAQEESQKENENLAHPIIESTKAKYVKRETLSPSCMQVSLSIISNRPVTARFNTFRSTDTLKKLTKGGVTAQVEIDGYRVNLASFHAHSQQDHYRAADFEVMCDQLVGMNNHDRYLSFSQINALAAPAIIAGDGNWRNIFHNGQPKSPYLREPQNTAQPTDIIDIAGFDIQTQGHPTYKGKAETREIKAEDIASRPDRKLRKVGSGDYVYTEGGELDIILTNGCVSKEDNPAAYLSVIPTTTSDHDPVIWDSHDALPNYQNDFERCKYFVINNIAGLTEKLNPKNKLGFHVLCDYIKTMEDTPQNKILLSQCFNYFYRVKQLAAQAEVERLKLGDNNATSKEINNTTNELTAHGLTFFNDKYQAPQPTTSKQKNPRPETVFQNKVTNTIDKSYDTTKLKTAAGILAGIGIACATIVLLSNPFTALAGIALGLSCAGALLTTAALYKDAKKTAKKAQAVKSANSYIANFFKPKQNTETQTRTQNPKAILPAQNA